MNKSKFFIGLFEESYHYMYHFTLRSRMWDIIEVTGLKLRKGKIYLFPKEAIERSDMVDWVRERFAHKSGDFTT